MRQEAPVYEVPGMGVFIVSQYKDLERVLLDTEHFSSKTGPGVRKEPPQDIVDIWSQGWLPVSTLLTNDPPAHRRFGGSRNGSQPSVNSQQN